MFWLLLCSLTLFSCYSARVEKDLVSWAYRGKRDAQALLLAVIEEDTAKIEELVGSGKVDVDVKARDGTRPLGFAILLDNKTVSYTHLTLPTKRIV